VSTANGYFAQRYLVDTTVLIDLSRGVAGLRGQLDALLDSSAELGVCAVNVAEFASGIPSGDLFRWEWLFGQFAYWEISREMAIRAGSFRYELARRGTTLHLPDALVAGVAAVTDATLLTDNVRHFYLIPDVRIRRLLI
jgi:predicted nucleic acid-binding protein